MNLGCSVFILPCSEETMFSTKLDLPQKTFQIKQDDKFFTRILARETSVSSHSFTEYGGLPGAVPFLWESQPGTPKNTVTSDITHRRPLTPPPSQPCCPKNTTFPDISLYRPLTPPPSSNLKPPGAFAAKSKLKHSRLLLLRALLAKMISLRKNLNIASTLRSSSSLAPPSSLISPRSWSSSLGSQQPVLQEDIVERKARRQRQDRPLTGKSEDEEAPGFGSRLRLCVLQLGLAGDLVLSSLDATVAEGKIWPWIWPKCLPEIIHLLCPFICFDQYSVIPL